MRTFVVIPCLNEEVGLTNTCASLTNHASDHVTIVLVDNGSDDDTWSVMQSVQADAAPGAVWLCREPVRGFVPARVRGAQIVLEQASSERLDPSEVLVLQADADTSYLPGYVDAMRIAARQLGGGRLLEGVSVPPSASTDCCAAFRALEGEIDALLLDEIDPAHDVIVDDKIAGYRLGDYLAWGGLKREYDSVGDEVHAETSRMYITAKLFGATRSSVENALAVTSQRKILRDPALAFATAGFPREGRWVADWRARYRGPRELHWFSPRTERANLAEAVATRLEHLRAMFVSMPSAMAAALDGGREPGTNGFAPPGPSAVRARPGLLFEWAFHATAGADGARRTP